MPINIPSQQRARAFLWLVYHYLEDPTSSKPDAPSTNPFADEYSSKNPGKVPWLPRLSTEDMQARGENVDPKEEIDWGSKMCALRTTFLQRLVKTSEVEKKNRSEFTSSEGIHIFRIYLPLYILRAITFPSISAWARPCHTEISSPPSDISEWRHGEWLPPLCPTSIPRIRIHPEHIPFVFFSSLLHPR